MMAGVELIEEFLKSQRLRWFVERISNKNVSMMAIKITVRGKKKRKIFEK